MGNGKQLDWKCHTPRLLDEILNSNEKMSIFAFPLNMFGKMLGKVADRAVEINDLELNKLMIRLTLYEGADTYSKDYLGADEIDEYLNSKENLIPTSKKRQLEMLEQIDVELIKEFLKDK